MREEEIISVIIKTVSDYYGIGQYELIGKSQNREIVSPRQQAHKLARTLLKTTTLEKIGNYIGGVDHCTVIYSVKTVSNIAETDKYYKENYLRIEKIIRDKLNIDRYRVREIVIGYNKLITFENSNFI